jgi:hypothetical protein
MLNNSFISSGEGLTDDGLSHCLIDSTPEASNSYIVRPGLTSSEEKKSFEFSSKVLEQGVALAEPVQVLVRLDYN